MAQAREGGSVGAVMLALHYRSGSTLEQHLTDQLILPAALCRGESFFNVELITPHLATNAWVAERFGLARINVASSADGTGSVKVFAGG